MNNKHLLVKSITLLYHESHLESKSSISAELVKRVIELIKLPDVSMGMDVEREVLRNLSSTAKKLIEDSTYGAIAFVDLNQQLMIDCIDDRSTYEAIKAGIEYQLEEEARQSVCNNIRRTLNQYMRDEAAKKHIMDFSNQLRFKPEEIKNLPQALFSLNNLLEPYYNGSGDDDPAIVASFGLDETDAIETVYEQIKERNEGKGGFRFGFQDINRMFGGSIEGGKMIVIGAAQHQHKTGFSLALFRQLLMYNIPHVTEFVEDDGTVVNPKRTDPVAYRTLNEDGDSMVEVIQFSEDEFEKHDRSIIWSDSFGVDATTVSEPTEEPIDEDSYVYYTDPATGKYVPVYCLKKPFNGKTPKRKPAMLRISTEDEIQDNMEQLFKNTYFAIERKMPNMGLVSPQQMREYIQHHLSRNGWHAHFMRINPSEWTYQNVCQSVLDLEAKGYDVKVVMVDYLPMIPTTGCTEGPAGYALRDMYRRVRNFMSA